MEKEQALRQYRSKVAAQGKELSKSECDAFLAGFEFGESSHNADGNFIV